MSASLPATIDRKAFEAPRRDFDAMEKELRRITGVPTLTQANLIKEIDDKAKAFLDKKNPDSPEAKIGPHRDKAYQTWKGLVAWLNDEERLARIIHGDPVKRIPGLAPQLLARYESRRLQKIAEQKRADEAAQQAEAERQRKAEADHFMEIAAATNDPAALKAAIDVENTPIASVISTVDISAGKVEGSSVTFVPTGKIVDPRAFLADIAQSDLVVDLVVIKNEPEEAGHALYITQSALDDKLKRGLTFAGVEVKLKPITRNTSRG